jgi:ketosteroid isomerase-like protein
VVCAVSSENIELVRRANESFNTDDDLYGVLFAEDAEVWPAPGFPEAGPFQGRDQIRGFFDGLREGWKGTSVVVRELEEVGDKVLASLQWRATGDASGVETSSDWMAVYTVRGGQFVRVQFFSDRDAAIDAAGLK